MMNTLALIAVSVGTVVLTCVALVLTVFGILAMAGIVSGLFKMLVGVVKARVHNDVPLSATHDLSVGRALVEAREQLSRAEAVITLLDTYGDLHPDHHEAIEEYFAAKQMREVWPKADDSKRKDTKHYPTAHGTHP